jgi:hypothetical protein
MKGSDLLILFRTMATNERASRKFREGSLLDRGSLSLREREIVIDRTTALANCEYEWGAHIEIFPKAVKFADEQIAATKNGNVNSACWSEGARFVPASQTT